jgi:predicted Zn-dependent protease with MMP-like domain
MAAAAAIAGHFRRHPRLATISKRSQRPLREMELETEFDILGLFRGVGLPQGGAMPVTGQLPNQVWLYRRPILDYWAESETGETLGEIITHVLVHEIGHHFGFSDEDMEAIEAAAERE